MPADTGGAVDAGDSGDSGDDAADGSDVDAAPSTCTPGGVCSTGCATGVNACSDGGLVCSATSPVQDGTPCGTGSDHVCSGGTCVTCAAGASCNDAAFPCLDKSIDCSTGAPVCKTTGNVADGKSCGGANYCYGGVCSPCTVGAGCAPASNPCHVGSVTSCANGQATCTDQGTNATTGTTCTATGGQPGVCVTGACEACAPSGQCHPNGNECQEGTMSCSAGPVCTKTGNTPDGTSCGPSGSGDICMGGTCGQPCGSSNCPNGCCGPGNACVAYANQTNLACGTGGSACKGCTAPLTTCGPVGACECPAGTSLCGSACVPLTTDNGNCGFCGHACGAGSTCTSGYCPPVVVCSLPGSTDQIALLGSTAYIGGVASCSLGTTGATAAPFWTKHLLSMNAVSPLMSDGHYLYWVAVNISISGDTTGIYLYRSDGTQASITGIDGYPSVWNNIYVRTDIDPSTGTLLGSIQGGSYIIDVAKAVDAGVPIDGCTAVTGGAITNAIAGGGRYFYADSAQGVVVGVNVDAANGTCSPQTTIAKGLTAPGALGTNGSTVAFADSNGVYACASSLGCIPQNPPTPLAANQGPVSLVVLDKASPPNVYWIGSAGLMKCSSDANVCKGKPTVLLPNVTPAAGITLDSTYVYYLQGSALYRVAK